MLVALLPHFSDYSKRLNLPIPTPITMSQVAEFHPPVEAGVFESALWLTNGYIFHYLNGAATGFNDLHNDWFIQQDIDGLERFAGKDNMTTNEAIDLARDSFVNLGYLKPSVLSKEIRQLASLKRIAKKMRRGDAVRTGGMDCATKKNN